ncbi:hypothetical protein [Microbacterium oleivorans]|uniref:Aminobenzoate synthetase n=1 Tax=Microbacterium oleivorans TaxID=273677 RepID=A0A7D5ETK8_9MICO|nr:hypothetical protein [Microbacterium oleivorans]QLD10392.1 hypothetical protein HW566_00450 [Microbacterium oleivorans]
MSSGLSRSSAERLDPAAAVEAVLHGLPADAVVVVDGRSGAGKSTFARALTASWSERTAVELVALDDLYPGWDGLSAGSGYALARILRPRARGHVTSWQQWDWERDRYDAVRTCPPGRALVLEGSGSLTPASAAIASTSVWLDAPDALRRRRALERDGETYLPHWERWAAQEDEHIRKHDPRGIATRVFDLG